MNSLEDFYKISKDDIKNYGGTIMLTKVYGGSILQALQDAYPDHKWLPWRFSVGLPNKFWDNKQNQREFMDWLGFTLGYTQLEDWYSITTKELDQNGGNYLLQKFNDSPCDLVQSTFPEHNWKIWMFDRVPNGFWKNKESQRIFMNWLGKHLGYTVMDDWYNIDARTIEKYSSKHLTECYNASPSEMLKSIYPEHYWVIWKFKNAPKGFWFNEKNIKQFMEYVAQRLQFTTMEDWYNLSVKNVNVLGGSGLMRNLGGSTYLLLKLVYPDHKWTKGRFK